MLIFPFILNRISSLGGQRSCSNLATRLEPTPDVLPSSG